MSFHPNIQGNLLGPIENTLPYVGLVNERSTCYLNSVIQMLFYLPSFRQKLYFMENPGEDRIILALRNLFAQLHCGTQNLTTEELTVAFGWCDNDACVQQDVHEMVQKLFDCLENLCKGTPNESFIRDLFYGEITYVTRVVDGVKYEAKRNEGFYDIELLVKDKKNIYESLDLWGTAERIENVSLEVEKGGPSTIHVIERSQFFARLPRVLLIHPNRAEFSMETFTVTTLPGKWEFPEVLDLKKYVLPTESNENNDSNVLGSVYELRSIIVHQGVANSGHYFTYVRFNDEWRCFNDIRVFSVPKEIVFNSAYGGDFGLHCRRSKERASLLVYVNRDAAKDVLISDDVPDHIKDVVEQINKKRLRETEKYEVPSVSFFIGEESFVDVLDDFMQAASYKKTLVFGLSSLNELHAAIAKEICLPPERIRVWQHSGISSYGVYKPRLHNELRSRENLFVEVLPERNEDCVSETDKEPFFAFVRHIGKDALSRCIVVHTRRELKELMNANGASLRCLAFKGASCLSEYSIEQIEAGRNIFICSDSVSEDFVLNLLRERQYKEVDLLLIDSSCSGRWETVGTVRVDENISYDKMQCVVYEHLTKTCQHINIPSFEHVGFHRCERIFEEIPSVAVCLMESNIFPHHKFIEVFCKNESRRQLFVAVLPIPLKLIDTHRIVLFNHGNGVRPVVYVERRAYTLQQLYEYALRQIGSSLDPDHLEKINQSFKDDIPMLRLIDVDCGTIKCVYTDKNAYVLNEEGIYVIDELVEVKPGFSRVNVVFCDRRTGEECFGFPTNIAVSHSYEETGAEIAQRVAERIGVDSSFGFERWIVTARSKSGKRSTVGQKELVKNALKEINGELDCFSISRPRLLLFDGVVEARQNCGEHSIIIRNSSCHDLNTKAEIV